MKRISAGAAAALLSAALLLPAPAKAVSADHAYVLEVSSPGLERPLKRPQDFIRFAGRRVRVKLRQDTGQGKVVIGTLVGLEDDAIVLLVDQTKLVLQQEQISRARLTLD